MKLYLDTEFNSYQGELLSIALVTTHGAFFYREIRPTEKFDPWVSANVVPHFKGGAISRELVQQELQEFLMKYHFGIEIIADWPEDIAYFCNLMITGPGTRINSPPIQFTIKRDIDTIPSKVPHNALEDARALCASDMRPRL